MSENQPLNAENTVESAPSVPGASQNHFKPLFSKRVGLVAPVIVIIFLLSLMGYWSFLGWAADLPSHFKMQYAMILLPCLIAVIVQKKPQWILIALLGLGMNLGELVPDYLSSESPMDTSEQPKVIGRFKLMQMNVHTESQTYAEARDAIRKLNPDVISLNEVSETWLENLRPVLQQYPYHVENARDDNFGIALYSKLPFAKSKIHGFVIGGVPSALAAIPFKKHMVTILSTHPYPPMSPAMYKERNELLIAIAQKRMSLGAHLVVVGDLNTTPFSPTFKSFTEATGLRDSRRGFGYQASWPSFFPLLWIPIDHILVSDYINVRHREIGPAFGSDHLPVMAELEILEVSEMSDDLPLQPKNPAPALQPESPAASKLPHPQEENAHP
ncbi:MAG TPA: endonuclease/exonuclease/phosphatase family protein [Coleofasciculaceae cyanobacterium]|jgi:endonuclease/exonuclease/phosphatase (EEP) superfamily protein YafD